jgi:hypothetical protein
MTSSECHTSDFAGIDHTGNNACATVFQEFLRQGGPVEAVIDQGIFAIEKELYYPYDLSPAPGGGTVDPIPALPGNSRAGILRGVGCGASVLFWAGPHDTGAGERGGALLRVSAMQPQLKDFGLAGGRPGPNGVESNSGSVGLALHMSGRGRYRDLWIRGFRRNGVVQNSRWQIRDPQNPTVWIELTEGRNQDNLFEHLYINSNRGTGWICEPFGGADNNQLNIWSSCYWQANGILDDGTRVGWGMEFHGHASAFNVCHWEGNGVGGLRVYTAPGAPSCIGNLVDWPYCEGNGNGGANGIYFDVNTAQNDVRGSQIFRNTVSGPGQYTYVVHTGTGIELLSPTHSLLIRNASGIYPGIRARLRSDNTAIPLEISDVKQELISSSTPEGGDFEINLAQFPRASHRINGDAIITWRMPSSGSGSIKQVEIIQGQDGGAVKTDPGTGIPIWIARKPDGSVVAIRWPDNGPAPQLQSGINRTDTFTLLWQGTHVEVLAHART